MKTTRMFRTITIFVALTIVSVCLVVLPQANAADAVQRILPQIGSAVFAAALAFFLVESSGWKKEG